jgi:hypothetical protein
MKFPFPLGIGALLVAGASFSYSTVLPTDHHDFHGHLKIRAGSPAPDGQGSSSLTNPLPASKRTANWETPLGLPKGSLELKLWEDMKARINQPDFKYLEPGDQMALYTGNPAWNEVNAPHLTFNMAYEAAHPGVNIRTYINIFKNDPPFLDLIEKYKEAAKNTPKGKAFKTLGESLASYCLGLMAREQNKPVVVLFSYAKDFTNAFLPEHEIPRGHLQLFEIYSATSEGSKVPAMYGFNVDTYKEKLKKKNFQGPLLWKKGDKALGKLPDFKKDFDRGDMPVSTIVVPMAKPTPA